MSEIPFMITIGVAYGLLDFVLAIALGRCVMPGLRCRACREERRKP